MEQNVAREAFDAPGDTSAAAIVKVRSADYVPPGIDLRARISPYLFTADVTEADLSRMQADDDVVSVSFARRIKEAE